VSNAIVTEKHGKPRDLRHPSNGWKSVTCAPGRIALCRHDETLDFFDTNHTTIPYAHTQELTHKYMPPVCTSSTFGREQTSATRTYTVSVCDLVHGHMHFVLRTELGRPTMLFKQDDTALWQVLLLAVITIYTVTMLSVHVCELVHPDESAAASQRSKYVHLLTHAVLAVALVATCATHHSFLVTEEDVFLSCCLYAFVLADLLFAAVRRTTVFKANDDSSRQVNGMLAFLLLVTSRLSSAFQNVFVIVLTILFDVRTCSKIVQTAYANLTWHAGSLVAVLPNLSVCLDVAVFYLLLSMALPQQSETEFETSLLLCTVLFSSFDIGMLLGVVLQLRESPQNW
jgi:hypothetical protein